MKRVKLQHLLSLKVEMCNNKINALAKVAIKIYVSRLDKMAKNGT
jgi:hypothetical protein